MNLTQIRRKAARGVVKVAAKVANQIYRDPERIEPYPTIQALRAAPWFRDRGDETLRLDYPLNERSVVIDLGGYEGEWASRIFSRYGCQIDVFEPCPDFARAISARFAGNSRVRVHAFGLAHENGSAEMSVQADGSSVHASGRDGAQVEIKLVQAAEFLERQGISFVDLMKINIEGAEYDLLEHLIATGWVKKIRDIQVQFHDFVPNADRRMARIQDQLEKTHAITYQYPFVWENWRLR